MENKLKASATEENWNVMRSEVELRAEVAKRIAEKNNLVFVPLMKLFDELSEKAPDNYLTREGVHPTEVGHEIIKREWIKAFKKL